MIDSIDKRLLDERSTASTIASTQNAKVLAETRTRIAATLRQIGVTKDIDLRGLAPDANTDMRSRPAHQSLFTAVPGRVPTAMRATSKTSRRLASDAPARSCA